MFLNMCTLCIYAWVLYAQSAYTSTKHFSQYPGYLSYTIITWCCLTQIYIRYLASLKKANVVYYSNIENYLFTIKNEACTHCKISSNAFRLQVSNKTTNTCVWIAVKVDYKASINSQSRSIWASTHLSLIHS